jgi:division protein CdvB (Snf7/Vps24/ESCRT-III family)
VLEEDLRNITREVAGEVLPDTQISYNTSLSSEAKKILEEAYLVAEEKIKSSLPKPDKDNKISLEETKGKIR